MSIYHMKFGRLLKLALSYEVSTSLLCIEEETFFEHQFKACLRASS